MAIVMVSDIVDTAVDAGSFHTLVAAIKAAGLVGALKGPGPFTVFAPTDEAFAKIPQETLAFLLLPAQQEKLQAILKYHVVAGKVLAADVVHLKTAWTLSDQELTIQAHDGVKVNEANVVQTDIDCANGVIHVIDKVLMPH